MDATAAGHGSPWQRAIGWIVGGISAPFVLWLFGTTFGNSTRLATIETHYQHLQDAHARIERKLDQLLALERK